MNEKAFINTTEAIYIGAGCFIRMSDGKLAFVNRENRPGNLAEGRIYELVMTATDGGNLYFVHKEVTK